MKYLLSFVLFLFSFFIILSSCTEPTKPPVDNGPDTTSHDFSWTIDTIGTRNSYLKDVAIINENDIWAVGEIHTDETDCWNEDSTEWIKPFNAVHWDGIKWELKRILYKNNYWDIQALFAFGANDIFFEYAVHWDGKSFNSLSIPSLGGHPNKLWGISSNDLYIVGTNGMIGHYDGQSWQRLESGTDIDIVDIWGALNPATGECEIMAVASTGFQTDHRMKILRIDGLYVKEINSSGLPWSLSGIWFVPGKRFYAVGDGVFYTDNLDSTWIHDTGHPLIYKSKIRGNGTNDVFIAAGFGLISHYNGNTWKHYLNNELPQFNGTYAAIDITNTFITAVGNINDRGIILRGLRKK